MSKHKSHDDEHHSIFKALKQLSRNLFRKNRPEKNVYFISGMCYNCKVFDKLQLPKGFKKHYLEWFIPEPGEDLSHYTRKMTESIDTSRPFILIGYSFGAVILQEMNRFLHPQKSVIISSFKDKQEIPLLFQMVRKTHLTARIPDRVFSSTEFITGAFNRLVYNTTNEELGRFMTHTDPVYIKWAIEQITNWIPDNRSEHLYHIHGTDDQIFPYNQLGEVIPVEGGDHLMVFKKADVISSLLSSILLVKEKQ